MYAPSLDTNTNHQKSHEYIILPLAYDYLTDYDFLSIGFSKTNVAVGSIDNFALTQIPVASTLAYMAVIGCATLLLTNTRRRDRRAA